MRGLGALPSEYHSLQGEDKPTTAPLVRNAVKTYGRSVVHRYPPKGKPRKDKTQEAAKMKQPGGPGKDQPDYIWTTKVSSSPQSIPDKLLIVL